ncbi:MAG: hypothetical protein VYD54_10190, partial [Bdellovibrionota bacterium]|nr:hypothetical protein [Bdellovibrionota bacterium]
MAHKTIVDLPEFEKLRKFLQMERDAYIKHNAFSEEEFEIRTLEEANLILGWLENLQSELHKFFESNISLIGFFEDEFCSLQEFFEREYLLETCFVESFLFSNEEKLFIGGPGYFDQKNLDDVFKFFVDWMKKKSKSHKETQGLLSDKFDIELKEQKLSCPCPSCKGAFRSKIRDFIFDESLRQIDESYEEIRNHISEGINKVSLIYSNLQKKLEILFKQVRSKLKRGSYNRLENQVKSVLKEKFNYPSDVSLAYSKSLKEFFELCLLEKNLKKDLIDDDEYKRFFNQ